MFRMILVAMKFQAEDERLCHVFTIMSSGIQWVGEQYYRLLYKQKDKEKNER